MGNSVKVEIKTNAKQVQSDLDNVKKKLSNMQKMNTLNKGVQSLNDISKISGVGDSALGKGLSSFSSGLSSVTKLINPWTMAITAGIAAATALAKHAQKVVDLGMPSANEAEKLNAKLSAQLGSKGIDTSGVVSHFQAMAENGVASAEHLTDAFIKLIPSIDGNVDEALKLVERFADVEAATGISADSLTSFIDYLYETGQVDDKMVKKLQKQNIPIMKELADMYGTDAAGAMELVKSHKVGVDEISKALMQATQMYEGTAAALSSTTEGSLASMEAARSRAMQSAAEATNEVLKAYYQEKQAKYDLLQADQEYQEQIKQQGKVVGEYKVLMMELGEAWDEFMQGLSLWLDDIGVFTKMTDDGQSLKKRVVIKNDNHLYEMLDKLVNHEYDNLSQRELEKLLIDAKDTHNYSQKNSWNANGMKLTGDALISGLEILVRKAANRKRSAEQETQEKQQQEKAAKWVEQIAADSAEAAKKQMEIVEKTLLKNDGNSDQLAQRYAYTDSQQLVSHMNEMLERVKSGVATNEEIVWIEKIQPIFDYIEKEQKRISDEKSKQQEEERRNNEQIAKEKEQQQRQEIDRMVSSDSIRRDMTKSDQYNRTFDTIYKLAEQLQQSNLSQKEKDKAIQIELARTLKNIKESSIRSTDESFSSGNLKSLKDFNFKSFEVDDKQLKVQEDIRKATKDAVGYQKMIADKLPSPTVAM